ncbi:hypothetical protein K6U06_17120 [Acidiferrimicrobium sp. IK]|uniref:hypothetical protein n=1 Tax=Acidiferrimicrobium sp. IK TaxID=2871700 RepID=UPI0021CB95E5|nr:hypothetical protein [Acidiferrimicrobium sp. IK]MCU4186093.1 hypothetical protein [Acidiferrimicrobium sp. IK]
MTIVVVIIDASLKSRSPAPAQTLSGQAWIDDVLPVIAASTTEGQEITQIRAHGLGMSGSQISAALNQAAKGAEHNYQSVLALKAPASAGGAPGLLEACLLVRAHAAQAAATAMTAVLSAAAPPASATDPNVQALATAGQDFAVSDRAYQLFASNLPKSLGVTMPASTWVGDPAVWTPDGLQVYLVALRNGTSLTPVHQLTIEAVSTNPPPVGTTNNVQQIAPTRGLTVTIVVADTGNQPENNLTISAAVSPSAPNQTSQVRDFANLTPGNSYATTIGPVVPVSGAPSTLTVTVTPPAGSATPPVTKTLQIEVAAPPPPSTTTTTSTTVAGKSSTSTAAG